MFVPETNELPLYVLNLNTIFNSLGTQSNATVSAFFKTMTVFILGDALSVWTNLGKHSLLVGLYVSRLERRTKEGSSSTRIMCLLPVFTLETNNQTNNECLPKFIQTDYASSSIKTANIEQRKALFCKVNVCIS